MRGIALLALLGFVFFLFVAVAFVANAFGHSEITASTYVPLAILSAVLAIACLAAFISLR